MNVGFIFPADDGGMRHLTPDHPLILAITSANLRIKALMSWLLLGSSVAVAAAIIFHG